MPRSPKHYCHHLQDNKLEKDSALFHSPSWIIHILLALHTWWYFPLHNSLKHVRSCVVGKPTTRVRLPTMTTVIQCHMWVISKSSAPSLRCHYCEATLRVLCLVEPPPPFPKSKCVLLLVLSAVLVKVLVVDSRAKIKLVLVRVMLTSDLEDYDIHPHTVFVSKFGVHKLFCIFFNLVAHTLQIMGEMYPLSETSENPIIGELCHLRVKCIIGVKYLIQSICSSITSILKSKL